MAIFAICFCISDNLNGDKYIHTKGDVDDFEKAFRAFPMEDKFWTDLIMVKRVVRYLSRVVLLNPSNMVKCI